MLLVYLEAPFAAFRTFTAGWYRPTATFLTPSAAYGLLLNVAGIDTRLREEDATHGGKTPATLIKPGLPAAELALGMPADAEFPRVQSVFQQLHNYPVGASGKERAPSCFGNKYNITPVRREFLSDLRAVVAVKTDAATEDLIRRGLSDDPPPRQYGIPFLGDNAFLLDRCEIRDEPMPVRWFEKITTASDDGPRERTTRLTILIDRADLSKTTSALFAPGEASTEPPATSWVPIAPPQAPSPTAVALAKSPRKPRKEKAL